jgi:hypothetical protein
MKINHVLESKNYLYEGLDASSLRSVKLWESAGRKLVEYQMTADQISQLFAQVQKGATDAGGNRTMIGKGKDAATSVKAAYDDLVSKVQNSGPMKDIDAQYDKAAAKLKQATGGDAGVMKYVEKYRTFAKAHPVAQSLIYSALIAAAGISGVGAGGAAALGLFKMVDKLLQGEKFSTSLGKGLGTAATAFAAGQVGKALQGGDQATQAVAGGPPVIFSNDIVKQIQNGLITDEQSLLQALKGVSRTQQSTIWSILQNKAGMPGSGDVAAVIKALGGGVTTTESIRKIGLSESQIKRMFVTAARIQQLNEGVWDRVKGAAGAVANKAQTVGTNLTTKVTADKLMSAWKKAGSPTDSDAVAKIMKQAGVDDAIIASSMKAVSGQQSKTDGAGAFDQMANQLAPADAEPAKPVDAQTQKFIQQLVASYQALTPAEKAQLKKELEDAVTASDVGNNVVKGTMESRRRKKRSV